MLTPQFSLPLHTELVVDNFAGGGGASSGMERAIGRPVDIAINHDPEAVAMHAANHPQTRHYCESVWDVKPLEVTEGRPVGLAWFSPDCKHHSKAKGGKPVEKKIRGLAWVALRWVATVRPRVLMLENVEEFVSWGPLTPEGRPCPRRKGREFNAFCNALRRHGYQVEHRELRACDYGAPTSRKRLFLIARCDGLPIVWPEPTHGRPGSAEVKARRRKPWRTAAECIDWSIPCPSIFERSKPLAEATLRRVARGIERYVVNAAQPFIVPMTHPGDVRVHGLGEPLRTVTGAHRGELAIAVPHITKFRSNSTGHPMAEPLHTITANGHVKRPGGAAPLGMVSATLVRQNPHAAQGTVGEPLANSEPAGSLENRSCARQDPSEMPGSGLPAAPLLIQTGYGERDGQAPRALDIEAPLGTIVAGAAKHALVAAFLAKHYGGVVGQPVDRPIGTVTATDHHSLVAAHLVGIDNQSSTGAVWPAAEPLRTTTTENRHALVTSNLVKLRGTSTACPTDEPAPTISAQGTHLAEVRAFLIKFYSAGGQHSSLHDPMHTLPTHDRMGLVTVEGIDYAIVDIGLRMLQPHELAAAQGFAPDYMLAPTVKGKPLTKTAQVRMVGNSVCPDIAAALVRANYSDRQAMRTAA